MWTRLYRVRAHIGDTGLTFTEFKLEPQNLEHSDSKRLLCPVGIMGFQETEGEFPKGNFVELYQTTSVFLLFFVVVYSPPPLVFRARHLLNFTLLFIKTYNKYLTIKVM